MWRLFPQPGASPTASMLLNNAFVIITGIMISLLLNCYHLCYYYYFLFLINYYSFFLQIIHGYSEIFFGYLKKRLGLTFLFHPCFTPILHALPPILLTPLLHHQVSGVSDFVGELEAEGLLSRHDPLGFDRHARTYWFLCRRIFVLVVVSWYWWGCGNVFNCCGVMMVIGVV